MYYSQSEFENAVGTRGVLPTSDLPPTVIE